MSPWLLPSLLTISTSPTSSPSHYHVSAPLLRRSVDSVRLDRPVGPVSLHRLLHLRQRHKRPPARVDSVDNQNTWEDDPESIHQDKVSPEVCCLRPRVAQIENIVVEHAGSIVQDVAVELPKGHDDLEGISERVVDSDKSSGHERHRAPKDLERAN
jgi:hypothetical protein